ncbi:MAG TPA: hypothetical protein VGE77_06010, partial [Nocardioides sp.]
MVQSEQVAAPVVPAPPLLSWRWVPVWALAVTGLALLGRLTATEPGAPSLVVPSTGIAVLWLLSRGVSLASLDALVLAAALVAVTVVADVPLAAGAVLVAGSLAQVGLTVALLRRWCGDTWGVARGTAAVLTTGSLARLVGAT